MTEEEKPQGWFKIALGVLVTIYGITAALVSFNASELDSKAREMTFVGIMELTKGNDAYSVADNQTGDDFNAVTQIILLEETGGSQTAIDIWYDTLSQEAFDAVERFGDLDDQYYDDLYAYPDELYDNANLAYETAQEFAEVGGQYEQIVLMLAMGLAFVGWASILDEVKLLRSAFGIIAVLVLVFSLYQWLTLSGLNLPPEVLPLQ